MKHLTATAKNLIFASLVSLLAFSANAATVVEIVSDNYLYESLIQTEFEIDTQTSDAIVSSATNLDLVVQTEMAQIELKTEEKIAE